MKAKRWAADLLLGARIAATGGRRGWTRPALTALGVGLGIALLLLAASVPNLLAARDERTAARSFGAASAEPGAPALLVLRADTQFRGREISGAVVQPERPGAPVPPGLARLPGPGELVASPALRRLLDSPDGALLRPRLDGPVVATIADRGLAGPDELFYYLGSDRLAGHLGDKPVARVTAFGGSMVGDPLDPRLLMLVVVMVVVLLVPIAVFVAAAVRFGADRGDRRLAALRLVGADRATTLRIAAGEALLGACVGVLAGAALFAAGRPLVEHVTLRGVSLFAADVRPDPALAALVAVGVPAAAVLAALAALRRIVVEPLGVRRRAGSARPRRLGWRLPAPVAGVLLIVPDAVGGGTPDGPLHQLRVGAGVTLLLVGTAMLLPWVVEAAVRRLGGGPVSWTLAVRRLQTDDGGAARAVGGVTVAVAGAIALQTLVGGLAADFTGATGQDPARARAFVQLDAPAETAAARFAAIPGVRPVAPVTVTSATGRGPAGDPPVYDVAVGNCAALRELARVDRCSDGQVFLLPGGLPLPEPGARVKLTGERRTWTVPATARTATPRPDPIGRERSGVFATRGALPTATGGAQLFVRTAPGDADAIERVRNAAASLDPLASVDVLAEHERAREFATIERALFIGSAVTLLLIGVSLLVGAVERLAEQRRALAVLLAFGTPRGALARSVLWQTAVPVLLGLVLAVAVGTGLGAVLLAAVAEPVRFSARAVAGPCAVAAATVLLVTAATLPPLRRLARPEGLRTE
ncbi:FtsX-like permease family protein [Actinomadura atramentaria]|uniref:FtsX-like permease family protein n=1 Tax=Actinomadura atramentaria TaxID=1990 RepID=UPI000364D5BE|nr:FtsX-like permease family protein [Actinomadura atramentaria]